MKKLLKIYGFNSDMQYFEMIVQSYINGQISQAYEQFKAMPRENRKAMLKSALLLGWECGLEKYQLSNLFNLI
jgi:uncharacterized membrane protein YbaN (DUF454 family)